MKKRVLVYILIAVAIAVFAIGCSPDDRGSKEKLGDEKLEDVSYGSKELIDEISGLISDYDERKLKDIYKLVKDKSIDEIQKLRAEKKFTYAELTATYLYRIKTKDQGKKGTNSFISVNPNVMVQAKALDEDYSEEMVKTYPLYGMSIGLKDNINTKEMATTAGSYALKDNRPKEDADIVKNLITNKALILGKNNLSEFAGFMGASAPAGYSGMKGQTHHGRKHGKDPSGSSSGSAAAVAANYCVASIGSDTSGSITFPSEVHSLVGIKPTHGKLSGAGIVPLASYMDSAGPITRTLGDSVLLMKAMGHTGIGDVRELYGAVGGLKGKRIGLLKSSESKDGKNDADDRLKKDLERLGFEVVDVEIVEDSSKMVDLETTLAMTMQHDLNKYLVKYNAPHKSLKEIVEYNRTNKKRAMRFGQDDLEKALQIKYDEAKLLGSRENAKAAIDKAIMDNKLDAIVSQGSNCVGTSSTAGYPVITIPTELTNRGEGLSIMGTADSETMLMAIGLQIMKGK